MAHKIRIVKRRPHSRLKILGGGWIGRWFILPADKTFRLCKVDADGNVTFADRVSPQELMTPPANADGGKERT